MVSDVLTNNFPLFVNPIPSGSTPTGISSIIILSFMSTTVTIASSSLAMYKVSSSGDNINSSGSGPDGR